jgi:hypothetical protein
VKSRKIIIYEQDWMLRLEDHAKLKTNGGLFDPDLLSIFIDPEKKERAKKTIFLHEIIHAIEYYWKFDLGKHPVIKELEIAQILEEGIMKILIENDMVLP